MTYIPAALAVGDSFAWLRQTPEVPIYFDGVLMMLEEGI